MTWDSDWCTCIAANQMEWDTGYSYAARLGNHWL